MKILKILAYITGIIIVLLAAAIFAFSQYFDPNKYKNEIISLAQPYIGDRQLNIEGDMNVSVFPWVGIDVGRVSLSQPKGFTDDDMIRFDKVNVQLKLAALIQGNIEADKIEIIKPYVHLITNPDGEDNFSDLLQTNTVAVDTTQHDSTSVQPQESTPAEQGDAEVITENKDTHSSQQQAPAFDLSRLRISGVIIEDGTIKVDNHSTRQKQSVSNFNLELGQVQIGEIIDTALSANISATQLPQPLELDFNGKVDLATDMTELSLFSTKLDLNYGQLPVNINIPAIKYQMDIDALSLPELNVTQQDLNLKTAVTAHNIKTAPKINASIALTANDLKAALSRVGVELNGMKHTLKDIQINSDLDYENNQLRLNDLNVNSVINNRQTKLSSPLSWFDINEQVIEIEKLSLTQDDLNLNLGSVKGVNVLSELAAMQISSKLNMSATNVGQLLADNGFDGILKPDAVKAISISTNINLANNNLALDAFDASIDDMTVKGVAKLQNLSAPAIDVKLNFNEVNVDNLTTMLAKSEPSSEVEITSQVKTQNNTSPATVATQNSESQADAASIQLPVEPIKSLQVKVDLNADKVVVSGLTMNQVRAVLNANNGVLKLSPLTANLVEGSIVSDLTYDVSANVPAIKINNKVNGINIGELLRALEINDQLEGKANLSTNLTAKGVNSDDVIASLTGSIKTQFLDGALRGIDLQSTLLKLKNTINTVKGGEQEQAYIPEAQTKFAELAASFNVSNGVFKSDDITMKAPALRLDGNGEINLPASKLNMRLGINVVKTVEGQGGASLEELEGVRIPFKVKGALTSPTYGIDFTALLKERAKAELKEKLLEELPGETEKVEKALEDPGSALKDLAREKLAEELGGGKKQAEGADAEKSQQAEDILNDPGKALEDAAKKELEKGLEKLFNF